MKLILVSIYMEVEVLILTEVNTLSPSDAVQKPRFSETENFILEDLFSSVLSQFKKIHHPFWKTKF